MSQRPDNVGRMARMETLLTQALSPTALEITDDSHLHVGHAGARSGRGYFSLRIRSAAFEGLSAVRRHQAVYTALGDMMQTDIHDLAIDADTPDPQAP